MEIILLYQFDYDLLYTNMKNINITINANEPLVYQFNSVVLPASAGTIPWSVIVYFG